MITINYNWKTYTTKEYTQWDTIIGAHVRNWIKKWFLEEVEEKLSKTIQWNPDDFRVVNDERDIWGGYSGEWTKQTSK